MEKDGKKTKQTALEMKCSQITQQSSTLNSLNPSKYSTINSNATSSSSSIANISISFLKDTNFPKLFVLSPQGPFPDGVGQWGRGNGAMTNSVGGERTGVGNFSKNSFFGKKQSQLTIEISTKQNNERQRILSSTNSCPKQPKNSTPTQPQNIQVFIRIKPPSNPSVPSSASCYISRLDRTHLCIDNKTMIYNHIFPVQSTQSQIFETVAQPVLDSVLDGFNGTVFVYGQTGSGKTYTMFGNQQIGSNSGLVSRALQYVFRNGQSGQKVSMSLLEIYKEELIDLISSSKADLKIKQTPSGINVQNLSRHIIKSPEQSLKLLSKHVKNRKTSSTNLNEQSSRSHTILSLHVSTNNQESKLSLIDLAGSQKAKKAGVTGQTFEEMKKINYSLSCLGNVINALVCRKGTEHVPYRDSKLTRLLKDSLSGKYRTSIIVNCSSEDGTKEETLSSLKFADRAKKVKIAISRYQDKEKENMQYLHQVIEQLTVDLQSTKRELNKYKQICSNPTPSNASTPQLSQSPPKPIPHPQSEQSPEPQPSPLPSLQIQPQHQDQVETQPQSYLNPQPQQIIPSPSPYPPQTQPTSRTTIPSQRIHISQQLDKYNKEAPRMQKINPSHAQKRPQPRLSINLTNELSSLNLSKSTLHVFGVRSPSVSSLDYCQRDQDLSFHFGH